MVTEKEPTTIIPTKSKNPLSKTLTEQKTLTFQNCRLENKLLQELSQKMTIVKSNAVSLKIFL